MIVISRCVLKGTERWPVCAKLYFSTFPTETQNPNGWMNKKNGVMTAQLVAAQPSFSSLSSSLLRRTPNMLRMNCFHTWNPDPLEVRDSLGLPLWKALPPLNRPKRGRLSDERRRKQPPWRLFYFRQDFQVFWGPDVCLLCLFVFSVPLFCDALSDVFFRFPLFFCCCAECLGVGCKNHLTVEGAKRRVAECRTARRRERLHTGTSLPAGHPGTEENVQVCCAHGVQWQ